MNLYNPVFLGPVTLLVGSSDRQLLKEISMNIEELKNKLAEVQATQGATLEAVTKVSGETSALLTKVAELQEAVNNAGQLPQEVVDAVNALGTQADAVRDAVAAVDALVPDASGGEEQQPG